MKKIIFLVLVLLLAAVLLPAAAETAITVTGTGETRVSADSALISLGVSARDRDVLNAQQTVNARISDIRNALSALGIEEENIMTNYINIYAIYDYAGDQEQLSAYNASSSLTIRVTDMDKAGTVIDAAFRAGANTLDNISFSADDTDAARAESLKKAVADAKAKAEVLAAASGLEIKETVSVMEGGSYSYSNSVSNLTANGALMKEEAAADGSGTLVQAAKIIVSETVTVTFTAE